MSESTKTRLAKATPWVAIPIVAAVAFGLGGWLLGGSDAPTRSADIHDHGDDAEQTLWTCSMHPQILPPCGIASRPLTARLMRIRAS